MLTEMKLGPKNIEFFFFFFFLSISIRLKIFVNNLLYIKKKKKHLINIELKKDCQTLTTNSKHHSIVTFINLAGQAFSLFLFCSGLVVMRFLRATQNTCKDERDEANCIFFVPTV